VGNHCNQQVRINEKIHLIRFEFVDDLKTMTTLSFTVNQKTKQDLLHRNACKYFIQLSTKMTNIMLEFALLYQKGNSTPYDIGSDQKIITTLKPEVPFQTHFYFYSNVTLKGCILLERVEAFVLDSSFAIQHWRCYSREGEN
jgi:hypothetical protein